MSNDNISESSPAADRQHVDDSFKRSRLPPGDHSVLRRRPSSPLSKAAFSQLLNQTLMNRLNRRSSSVTEVQKSKSADDIVRTLLELELVASLRMTLSFCFFSLNIPALRIPTQSTRLTWPPLTRITPPMDRLEVTF